jgi:hypothetical protein
MARPRSATRAFARAVRAPLPAARASGEMLVGFASLLIMLVEGVRLCPGESNLLAPLIVPRGAPSSSKGGCLVSLLDTRISKSSNVDLRAKQSAWPPRVSC